VSARTRTALLVVFATIGAVLLLNVATRWFQAHDESAYWEAGRRLLAGQPLYQPSAGPAEPFVYWYPPPLAQLLAPLTAVVPQAVYIGAFTALLLGCLWWLSGRRLLVALAMIAFVPVAVELMERNVHLILAVLIVLALRRSPLYWVPAVALKVAPILGVLYLVVRGRYREAAGVLVLGVAALAVSVAISPTAWAQFLDVAIIRGGSAGGDALLPVPYALRFVAGAVLAVMGGRLPGARGEALLVAGVTIANPTLWAQAFSVLLALIPLATWWPVASPRPMTQAGPSG
jgi:alpha-1,2-mannosyltransferase